MRQQYTPHSKKNEKTKRNAPNKRKLEIEGRLFNCNTVKEAVRDTKKSPGPSRIAPVHLHHLSPIAPRYLLKS